MVVSQGHLWPLDSSPYKRCVCNNASMGLGGQMMIEGKARMLQYCRYICRQCSYLSIMVEKVIGTTGKGKEKYMRFIRTKINI